ncbi:MAG: hypothetical protein JXR48_18125 [Candidatus Delongbacteria bacterium]|nr:hypothetical protein [Candidatus Delongbacteria bacterium]MBN2836878.1 hypothetical protein [Candidatus Delongbacteria bacterium]
MKAIKKMMILIVMSLLTYGIVNHYQSLTKSSPNVCAMNNIDEPPIELDPDDSTGSGTGNGNDTNKV